MDNTTVDDRYYEAAPERSVANGLMGYARLRMFDVFRDLHKLDASSTVLDVGVSDVLSGGDNMLERLYPYPNNITALGLGEGSAFRQAYPMVTYRQIEAHQRLPFEDRGFTLATSNAVVEHLGSLEAQKFFLAELLRVAEQVFLTAPNRWFPVEHHTGLPFANWNNRVFRQVCRITGKASWANPAELILTSANDLKRLAKAVAPLRSVRIGTSGIPLGPFSSNIYLSIR